MAKSDLIQLAVDEAKSVGLDPHLIQAIIGIESNWDPDVMRCEINILPVFSSPEDPKIPHTTTDVFRYTITAKDFAHQNGISLNTEVTLQKSSFGLMQLMGHNFRDLGFGGMLTKTLDPQVNLMFGCKFFKVRCDKYDSLEDKIASYNAGSPRKTAVGGKYINQGYVDKVKNLYDQLCQAK